MRLSCRDAGKSGYGGSGGVSPVVPRIRALGLISGMFYTCRLDSIGMFLPDMLYGKGWRSVRSVPIRIRSIPRGRGNLPPSFLVTAREISLQHYSRRFYRAISGTVRRIACWISKETDRRRTLFPAMLPETPEARDANGQMAAFLLRHC